MRSQLATFVLAITLAASAVSLLGTEVAAINGLDGCCVCLGCDQQNSTMFGSGNSNATCFPSGGAGGCEGLCFGCLGGEFLNVTCTDPSLAEVCGESSVMAPATSPGVMVALVALLAGVGAFLLRRRSA